MQNEKLIARLHGRAIDNDSSAFIDFAVTAYLAENHPSQLNKIARAKAFKRLVRANDEIINNKEKN
ncbi:MAG: hypothetical protein HRU28_13245 [Rhizobiales bacterium]|nr:hypothetical protein [Hyphomicrobiales bacterium]